MNIRSKLNFPMILLFAWLVFLWTLNTAPAFHFPLFPELISISFAIFFIKSGRLFPSEVCLKIALSALIIVICANLISCFNFSWELEKTAKLCVSMPGFFQKVECIFQSGVELNPGPRQILYQLTGLALLVAGYNLKNQSINRLFIICGLFFIVLTLVLSFNRQLRPLYWIGQAYANNRMSILFENPTWIWPYLVPSILSCYYEICNPREKIWKFFAYIALIGMAIYLPFTQQRGAFLVAVATFAFLGFHQVAGRLKVKGALIFVAVGIGCLVSIWFSNVSTEILLSLHNSLKKSEIDTRLVDQGFFNSGRLPMWKLALEGTSHKIWFGNGFGSWYRVFSPLASGKGIDAYDTAHNFFVQTFFESGLVGLLIDSLIFGGATFWLIKNSLRKKNALIFVVFGCSLYMLILTFQELDFIRSTFYSHCIFIGWIFSQSSHANRIQLQFFRLYSASASIILLCIGCLMASTFTLGGYQYEADPKMNFENKVRWLKKFGTINFVKMFNANRNNFSLYPVVKSSASTLRYKFVEKEPINLNVTDGEVYIPVEERGVFDFPDFYEMDGGIFDISRYLSTMLAWPPIVTQLPTSYSKGLLNWERSPHAELLVRWCSKTCTMTFPTCATSNQFRTLKLISSREDISYDNVLKTEITSNNYKEVLEFKLQDDVQTVILKSSTVTINSSSVLKTESDSREKGILVLSANCE